MKTLLKTLFIAQALLIALQLKAFEPVVTSTPIEVVDEDSHYSYQLLANDADQQPVTWQVKSDMPLPSWLTLTLSHQVSTYAGSGIGGIVDSDDGLSARFNTLTGITGDRNGNLYVSEFFSYRLRTIAPDGGVITVAGDGNNGDVDSNVPLQAQLGNVRQISADNKGNIYLAGDSNHKIRQFDVGANKVLTLAGSGVAGASDNPNPLLAEFSNPFGIAIDAAGHVYVSQATSIRKIDAQSGAVTTLAGSSTCGADDNSNPLLATFSEIKALVVDSQNNIYLTDANRIRKISHSGVVTTIAGGTDSGDIDSNNALEARFNVPQSLALDSQGHLYIGDYANHKIRKFDGQTNAVSTFAGTGNIGFTNSSEPLESEFNFPTALFINSEDVLFVTDWLNYRIRKISPTALLHGTPSNDDVGVHPVCLVASDGSNDVEHCFDITVNNTNDAPSIGGTPPSEIAEDSRYTFTPQATDIDVTDTLRFTISNKPIWATFDTSTGELSGTPTNAHVGRTENIVISVNDGIAQDSLAPFSIVVTNTNDAPTIGGVPSTQLDENTPYEFTPNAADVDVGDVLTFSVTNLPSWASFDTVTGTLSGTPTRAHLGVSEPITITVSDSQATDSLTFSIEVLLVNDAPVINEESFTIDEDTSITFDVEVSDGQNDPLALSIATSPANGEVTIDGLTATYTPKANYYGTDSFNLIANDGIENSIPATFTVNIADVDDESAATNDVIYVDFSDDNTAYLLDVMANDNTDAQLQIVAAFSLDGEVTISNDQLILAITNQTTPPSEGKTITVDYVLIDGDGKYTHAQVAVILRGEVLKRQVLRGQVLRAVVNTAKNN